jgi:hypothetical protein
MRKDIVWVVLIKYMKIENSYPLMVIYIIK